MDLCCKGSASQSLISRVPTSLLWCLAKTCMIHPNWMLFRTFEKKDYDYQRASVQRPLVSSCFNISRYFWSTSLGECVCVHPGNKAPMFPCKCSHSPVTCVDSETLAYSGSVQDCTAKKPSWSSKRKCSTNPIEPLSISRASRFCNWETWPTRFCWNLC